MNFNDEYYFSHFFKRESGVSPREFRQQVFETSSDAPAADSPPSRPEF